MKHPLLKQNAEVPKEEVEAVSESSTSFVSKAASPQWDGWGPWRKRRQDFPTCVGKKGVSVFQIREIVVLLQSSVRRFCMRCFCLWVCVFMIYIYIYMFSTFSHVFIRERMRLFIADVICVGIWRYARFFGFLIHAWTYVVFGVWEYDGFSA